MTSNPEINVFARLCAMLDEVGDLTAYVKSKLATANQVEKDRHK